MEIGTEQIIPSRFRISHKILPYYKPSPSQCSHAQEWGILDAVLVNPLNQAGQYELVMGEAAWRTAIATGIMELPARIHDVSRTDLSENQLFDEDFYATHPNPISRAKCYSWRILAGKSQTEIARDEHTHRATINHHLNLLQLPDSIQLDLLAGRRKEGHARHLHGLSRHIQLQLWDIICQEKLLVTEAWRLCREAKQNHPKPPSPPLPYRHQVPTKIPISCGSRGN